MVSIKDMQFCIKYLYVPLFALYLFKKNCENFFHIKIFLDDLTKLTALSEYLALLQKFHVRNFLMSFIYLAVKYSKLRYYAIQVHDMIIP